MQSGICTRLAAALCIVIGASTTLPAERKPEARFSRIVDLPSSNLRLPVLAGTSETPLPAPKVLTYLIQEGAESTKVDCYIPRELWTLDQIAGQWTDEFGSKLTLAVMKCPKLPPFAKEHIPKPAFNIAYAAGTNSVAGREWNEAMLRDWVSEFTAAQLQPSTPPDHPSNLKDLVFYKDEQRPNLLAFAFRLSRQAAGQTKAFDGWYFLSVDLNRQIPADKARETAMATLLPKITTCGSTGASDPTAIGPSGKFQNEKALHTGRHTPEFIASREQVANSIKNMRDWWYAETDNYIFLSDLKTKNRTMVRQLQTDIECLRDAYEQFMPPRVDINAVSVIRIFDERKDYEAYVPKQFSWSAGMWLGEKRELVIMATDWANRREAQQTTVRTVYHEAFHQYIFYAYDMVEPAVWFNEGMAQFYENAAISEQRLRVEENKSSATKLEAVISGGKFDLGALTGMSYKEFYGGDEKNRETNYALAWGLTYYLLKGAPLETPAKYSRILQEYTDTLWTTKDAAKATQKAFEKVNMDELQKDFMKFWKSQSKRSAARRNDIFKAYSGPKK